MVRFDGLEGGQDDLPAPANAEDAANSGHDLRCILLNVADTSSPDTLTWKLPDSPTLSPKSTWNSVSWLCEGRMRQSKISACSRTQMYASRAIGTFPLSLNTQ
jgi:hypothetical protein